jgi:hypothetical protein
MKKNFQRFALLAAATGSLLCVCIPPANSIARRPAFPVANEKVYLYPAIDSSLLSRFSGWPSEASLQAPLRRALRKLDSNLSVEFRRCEKYGLYELVDDSLSAGVRVTPVIGQYQFKKDTLEMPVQMTLRNKMRKTAYLVSMTGRGIYRAKTTPKSPYHYIAILLADFCRTFPYERAAEVFYRPAQSGKPVAQPKKATP